MFVLIQNTTLYENSIRYPSWINISKILIPHL